MRKSSKVIMTSSGDEIGLPDSIFANEQSSQPASAGIHTQHNVLEHVDEEEHVT